MVLKTNMKWRLFMNQTLLIWLYAVALAAIYLFVALAVSIFSRLSLRKNPKSSISEQVIEIDTETELLEYELRLALAASAFRKTNIIVFIGAESPSGREALDIVRRMRRRHKNIFYKMI
jgi:hypothetical protein